MYAMSYVNHIVLGGWTTTSRERLGHGLQHRRLGPRDAAFGQQRFGQVVVPVRPHGRVQKQQVEDVPLRVAPADAQHVVADGRELFSSVSESALAVSNHGLHHGKTDLGGGELLVRRPSVVLRGSCTASVDRCVRAILGIE